MGKRQVGELEPSELVLSLIIADLASVPMQDYGIPLLTGILPILALLAMTMILSVLTMKSVPVRAPPCAPPPVHASDAAKSEMRVVIPGPFGRVEVRSVHRGEFDPADGVGLRVPDDREAVFGDIQYIGSVCDAYRRRHGGLGEGGGRQQERAQQ